MKKILFALLTLSFTTAVHATDYVSTQLGFDAGTFNFGVDYEKRTQSKLGLGGYFMFSSDSDSSASPGLISFGGLAKIHLLEVDAIDLSLAPGFGVSIIDTGRDDETTFGPVLKFGAVYEYSQKMAFGFEAFSAYNWFSNDLANGRLDLLNLTMRLTL